MRITLQVEGPLVVPRYDTYGRRLIAASEWPLHLGLAKRQRAKRWRTWESIVFSQ